MKNSLDNVPNSISLRLDPESKSSELQVLRKFWLKDTESNVGSHYTILNYTQQSQKFLDVTGAKTVQDFNRETVRLFLDRLLTAGKYEKSSIRAYLRTVKVWWNWLLREDYEVDPKIKFVKPPKVEKRAPETLSADELQQMVSSCNKTRRGKRDSLMLRTFFTTGIRLAELSGLLAKDIVIQNDSVFAHIHGKGAKDRFVDFPEGLDQAILRHASLLQPEDRLFGLGSRGVFERIRLIARRSGLTRRIYPHLFRHSYATNYMEQQGSDSMKLMKKLGHETLTMSMRYTHFQKRGMVDGPRVADPTYKKKIA